MTQEIDLGGDDDDDEETETVKCPSCALRFETRVRTGVAACPGCGRVFRPA